MLSIGHVEVPARDLECLGAFYLAAFGWEAAPLAWPGPAYTRLRLPAGAATTAPRIGLATAQPYDQPLVVLHVSGEPLTAVADRVVVAGGRIESPPVAVDTLGWFAVIADPEGNRWGLWSASR